MKEGWHGEDYWVMCEDQQEAERLTASYGISQYLPGYFIVGLKGWDDFILCDRNARYFTVPSVPLDSTELKTFQIPDSLQLESDDRFTKKIKWYVKPIAFGGEVAQENTTWLSMDEHVEVVKWWNQLYYDTVKTKKSSNRNLMARALDRCRSIFAGGKKC